MSKNHTYTGPIGRLPYPDSVIAAIPPVQPIDDYPTTLLQVEDFAPWVADNASSLPVSISFLPEYFYGMGQCNGVAVAKDKTGNIIVTRDKFGNITSGIVGCDAGDNQLAAFQTKYGFDQRDPLYKPLVIQNDDVVTIDTQPTGPNGAPHNALAGLEQLIGIY